MSRITEASVVTGDFRQLNVFIPISLFLPSRLASLLFKKIGNSGDKIWIHG